MNHEQMRNLAKKTFIALDNSNNTVIKVFPEVIDQVKHKNFSYIGVKNRPEIPRSLIHLFESTGKYGLHTLDAYSQGGRAIDLNLQNPITGLPMTGSSSGTAINVLLGINDLGIGTDGGGSVLAPAMSLNLFSFISPSIAQDHTAKFKKISTDSHSFTPSIGFITRELDALINSIQLVSPEITQNQDYYNIVEVNHALSFTDQSLQTKNITNIDLSFDNSREYLLSFLDKNIDKHDLMISLEGPIDFHGLDDSVLGHMGSEAKAFQNKGNKGLIRVANMAGMAAMSIPTLNHAQCYVLLTKDKAKNISFMIHIASKLAIKQDKLLKKYFMGFDNYFTEDF